MLGREVGRSKPIKCMYIQRVEIEKRETTTHSSVSVLCSTANTQSVYYTIQLYVLTFSYMEFFEKQAP